MSKIIHLSDLHIHSTSKENNRNLQKLVGFIVVNYSPCDVIITGDITDDGYKAQYRNAVELLRPLVSMGFNIHAVPGNHDYGYWGLQYSEGADDLFDEWIYSELLDKPLSGFPRTSQTGDLVFIGLCSAIRTEHLAFASGRLGKGQRVRLAGLLETLNPFLKKIVYMHHHPFDVGRLTDLEDSAKLMRILDLNSVDCLLFGHEHLAHVWENKAGIETIIASGASAKELRFVEIDLKDECTSVKIVRVK